MQLFSAWHVLAPPYTVSLHTGNPVSDEQSALDRQYSTIKHTIATEILQNEEVPAVQHTSTDIQYAPSVQADEVPHEEVGWQVRGPPAVNSLQDVKLVTVEQSDITEQTTREYLK